MMAYLASRLWFIALIYTSLLIISTTSLILLPSLEANALHDFYISLDGDNWSWQNDTESYGIAWDFDNINNSDPCIDHWQGIHCTCLTANNATSFPDREDEDSFRYTYANYAETYSAATAAATNECHIDKINLNQYNLVGSIPQSIRNLSYLQVLQLADNSITGKVDSYLWHLHSLESLVIHNNLLTGPIPKYMDMVASNLSYFAIGKNSLSGSVPESLCKLSALKMFTISGSAAINSTLPDCIGNITQIDTFVVSQTSMTGTVPESICNWQHIRDFTFNANLFLEEGEGNLPVSCFGSSGTLEHIQISNIRINRPFHDWSALCDNHHLITLQAASCGLTGPLPGCFSKSNMPNFTFLNVQYNLQLTGSIPFTLLENAMIVDVSYNQFNGTIVPTTEERRLSLQGSRLQKLIVNNNQLTGTLPAAVLSSSNISIFLAFNNHISGSISPTLCLWTSLNEFHVNSNQMTGSYPHCISNWTALRLFSTATNSLTGSLPDSICNGWKVEIFVIAILENLLTGTLPSCMGDTLPTLQDFNVRDNQFTGSIPNSFCQWNKFTYLTIMDNFFTGTLPDCIGNWTEITGTRFDNNMFTGTLPNGICTWNYANFISFADNMFTGTLPNCIGNWQTVQQLYLCNNLLHGSLPESLCSLPDALYVQLYQNLFSGSIPECLPKNWQRIIQLFFWDNHFTGTISEEWCMNHLLLQIFDLWGNRLTGTVPSCLWGHGNNDMLRLLAVEENQLTGPFFLPQDISCPSAEEASPYNPNLQYITANDNNHLTGEIPSCIGRLFPKLQNLDLGGNAMNGSIPASLCEINTLYDLQGYGNDFTGTLPDCWTNEQTNLEQLAFSDSNLQGTLPNTLCNLISLGSLLLGGNQFTGSIPTCYGVNMTDMIYFNISSNQLTGTLSENLCNMYNNTVFFALNDNHLQGGIPACIGSFQQLQYLLLSFNELTGSLSFLRYNNGSVAVLPKLVELSVEHNKLTGALFEDLAYASSTSERRSSKKRRLLTQILAQQNKFTGSLPTTDWETKYNISLSDAFGSLLVVDIAQNDLTGKIDPSLFIAAPGLSSVVLIKNCFSGQLSADICLHGQSKLQVLALDGLSANCNSKAAGGGSLFSSAASSSSSSRSNTVHGSIPSCYFALPYLQIFHAAGNNFIGSIPSESEVNYMSSNLTDLSLSHNDLRGTIPASLQRRIWSNLDLSFNKFDGSLVDSDNDSQWIVYGRSVKLDRNRLSGNVPNQYLDAHDVNILNGNLFSCKLDAMNQLPDHDPYANSYSCGTDSLNLMLFVGAGLLALAALVLLMWMIAAARNSKQKSNGHDIVDSNGNIESYQVHLGLPIVNQADEDNSERKVTSNNDDDHDDHDGSDDIVINYPRSSSPSFPRRDREEEKEDQQLYLSSSSSNASEEKAGFERTTRRIKAKHTMRLHGKAQSSLSDASNAVNTSSSNKSDRSNNDASYSSSVRSVAYTELKDRCVHAVQLLQTDWQRASSKASSSSLKIFAPLLQSSSLSEQSSKKSKRQPAYHIAPSDSLARFLQVCDHQRRLYQIILMFSLFVALPLFTVLSVYYKTLSSSYAWIISAAYLGVSVVPAIILLAVWVLSFVWLYQTLDPELQFHGSGLSGHHHRHSAITMRKIWQQLYQIRAFWQEYGIIALALLINAVLILVINGVYVYLVINNGRAVSVSLQITLVAFKLLYNGRFVSKLIRGSEWLHHLRKRQQLLKKDILFASVLQGGGGGGGSESLISSNHSENSDSEGLGLIPGIYSEAALVIFNLVVVPIVAALCVNTNCFYSLIVPPQPLQTLVTIVSSAPSYRFFWNNEVAAFSSSLVPVQTTINTEFIPPFTYSGQCASSIIATYEPVFVLLFLANLFLLPLMRFLRRIYLKRLDDGDDNNNNQENSRKRRRQQLQAMTERMTGIPTKPEVLRSLSFDRRSFVVARVTNLSILLTFGWVFPPLAFLIALVEIRDSIYIVAALQQYIIDMGSMQEAEKELGWFVKGIATSLPYLQIRYLPLGTICLGLLLYDIAADQVGLLAALWAPLLMSFAPWIFDQAWLMWKRASAKHDGLQQQLRRIGGVYIIADQEQEQEDRRDYSTGDVQQDKSDSNAEVSVNEDDNTV